MAKEKNKCGNIMDTIKENTKQISKGSKRRFSGQKQSFKERHKESTAPQPKIKEKFKQEKEAFNERHSEATAPNSDVEKVKQARGVGNKIKAIAENIADGAKENTKKEKKRRQEILNNADPKK